MMASWFSCHETSIYKKSLFLLTWKRTDMTAPHISSPTMNCSPNIARIMFSQQREARPFRNRTIHFPPFLLAESWWKTMLHICEELCQTSIMESTVMVYYWDYCTIFILIHSTQCSLWIHCTYIPKARDCKKYYSLWHLVSVSSESDCPEY